MLTNHAFWVGVIATFIAMYVWHKYQSKKAGA